MTKKFNLKKKDDVIESIEKSKRKISLSKKQDPKEKLTDSIESQVKEMVLKIEKERANAREDVAIALGKGGGEDLEFFTDDISNNYEYSIKDSKAKKEKPKTDFVLRPVSILDTFDSKK